MASEDIRWQQRFANFKKALAQLEKAFQEEKVRKLSNLEKLGVIHIYGFTHELAWNVIKDYFEYQGIQDIKGPRDAVRLAFSKKLIEDGEVWMEMIKSGNKSSHTYNEETAEDIVKKVLAQYFQAFEKLKFTFEKIGE